MTKTLDALCFKPVWTSHLGCIKGCLEYLGLDMSDAWLFGATGHAFVINVHEVVCPSGPTAWKSERLFALGQNAGYRIDGVFGFKSQHDFAQKQRLAWDRTRQAIDESVPCYGWELGVPEYYVVYGYDDNGYLYRGPQCGAGNGVKPWGELGDSGIGVLEMYQLRRGSTADDTKTVREALAFGLEHAAGPEKWVFPDYRAGLEAYRRWMCALENGRADALGMAYNAAVWGECRAFAVGFLSEARDRVGGPAGTLLDEAGVHYEVVARNLKRVCELYPFGEGMDENIRDEGRRRPALEALNAAMQAEAAGLDALGRIVAVL